MNNSESKDPVVSIIIPTYNRVDMLEKSIESVFSQTFTDWELIIIDDASTDETEKRMTKLSEKEPAVNYMRIPKITGKGISEYLNIGLRNSNGEYIARIDDDDFWCHKDKLKMQVEFLDKNVEDMELWLRMGMEGKLYNFKEYFITYMTAGQNKSFTQQRENSRTVVNVVKMHGKNYPNYYKAYMLNYTQYMYSFLPVFFKKRLQSFMYYLKRKNF